MFASCNDSGEFSLLLTCDFQILNNDLAIFERLKSLNRENNEEQFTSVRRVTENHSDSVVFLHRR
jgi:hypothetical protein